MIDIYMKIINRLLTDSGFDRLSMSGPIGRPYTVYNWRMGGTTYSLKVNSERVIVRIDIFSSARRDLGVLYFGDPDFFKRLERLLK